MTAAEIIAQEVREEARLYCLTAGLGAYKSHTQRAVPAPTVMAYLADYYASANHAPYVMATDCAYSALCAELKAQWYYVAAAVKIEPWLGRLADKPSEPYANSEALMASLSRRVLFYLPTDKAASLPASHPMLETSPVRLPDSSERLCWNDVFRVIHDYFGHGAGGWSFGPIGELNAWLSHSRMFSPLALRALTVETLLQNAWVNYGPHMRRANGTFPAPHDCDFVPLRGRPFAEQKAFAADAGLVSMALSYAGGLAK